MIVVVRRNQEKIVPDFVLGNFMLYRFLGKYQTDAGAIFFVPACVVAIVNLKLQVGAGRNAQREARRPSLGQVPGQIEPRNNVQIPGGLARNSPAVG